MSASQLRLTSALVLALLVGATAARDASAQTGGTGPQGPAAAPPPLAVPPAPPPPPPGPGPAYSPPPPPPPGPGPAYAPPPAYSPPPPGAEAMPVVPPESPKHFGVFIDPLNLLLGTIGAEVSISPITQIAINAGFQYRKDDVTNDPISREQIDLTQYGARLGLQIFPTTERTMRGFYLYPRGTYVKGSTNETQYYKKADTTGLELAGMAGYQWRWNNGFAIRLGGGIAYRKVEAELSTKNTTVGSSTAKVGVEGATLAAEFALGWCF